MKTALLLAFLSLFPFADSSQDLPQEDDPARSFGGRQYDHPDNIGVDYYLWGHNTDVLKSAPVTARERVEEGTSRGRLAWNLRPVREILRSSAYRDVEKEPLTRYLSDGEYEKVVKIARAEIDDQFPWWKTRNAVQFLRYEHVLAIAHELNGDWTDALDAYAVIYGDHSEEFDWSNIRILYATGQRYQAFQRACRRIRDLSHCSVVSVNEKISHALEVQKEGRFHIYTWDERFYLLSSDRRGLDREWFALWGLRDNCARVVCPELHFVTTISPFQETNAKKRMKYFPEYQKECFEKFVAFMEEEYAKHDEESPWYKENGEAIAFLHELEKIPYLVYPSSVDEAKRDVSAEESNAEEL